MAYVIEDERAYRVERAGRKGMTMNKNLIAETRLAGALAALEKLGFVNDSSPEAASAIDAVARLAARFCADVPNHSEWLANSTRGHVVEALLGTSAGGMERSCGCT